MKTIATVTEILSDHVALVTVERRAACDGCHHAEGDKGCSVCTLLGGNREAVARARNKVGAAVGDRVEIESRTSRMIAYAAFVFLFPVVLLFVGYFLGGALFGEKGALFAALGGLVVAFLPVGLYSRFVVSRRTDVEIVAVRERKPQ